MKNLLILLAIMMNLSCTQAQQMTSGSDDSLLRLAEQRRSVRQYTNEPVDRETIDKILTVAALAPSSYGQNPVEFVVVEDREQLSKLAACKRIGAPSLRIATAAVVVMADTTKGELWVEDASVAAGYLLLAAEQYGIGACWNQIHLRDGQRPWRVTRYASCLAFPPVTKCSASFLSATRASRRLPAQASR